MIGIVDELRARFDRESIELFVPEFVQIVPEAELIELVPIFDGWIIGDDPATAAVLEAGHAGSLRACVKWGVGTDNVDFETARRLGIPVTNTPAAFGNEVADVAMSYVVGLARETFAIDRGVRAGGWPKPRGISLAGRLVTLVGFGDIGQQTARRLLAAEMEVRVVDPFFSNAAALSVQPTTWPQAIKDADFVVFTCPLTPNTKGMLNSDTLRLAKPGLRVVNVARGPIIDEVALVTALRDGTVHSAALDVFEIEPLPESSALRGFDRCILGSHNASNTEDAVRRVSNRASDFLIAALGST
ncbi:phosphoglycerate dehydrogenase [Aestuariicoccus sp. MJ-SS9]|uniref:phosphoglycerate dehydrogenase n=1 Tax=Aestuariicoccus sp. MJ-SS9 TaxID=3079855 RepID=UPI00290792B7|nr:phosphoglycerate dehydrogenase [Aestuariicoccus sp. MJ-SS9]MDU8913289.1 phosphoglycerate dehydrogenase [Aestuariicoccus sp. MJ-SS9]